MSEIPDFLQGIDPAMIRDLEQQMDADLSEHNEREVTLLESYRQSYMKRLAIKKKGIDSCLDNPSASGNFMLGFADEVARSHFAYYVDKVFLAPLMINKSEKLVEALDMADISQMRLNKQQVGFERVYNDITELRTIVERILQSDNQKEAAQDIIDMYDRTVREVVNRFIFNKQ